MAEKKLAVVFTSDTAAARKGVADLNKALGSTEAQAKKTGSSFRSTLGDVAIVAGLKFAVDESEEAEATLRKTEAVIRSTGNAAQVSAGQQEQMVDQLSQLAAVDDEIVAGGANILRTFKSIQGEEVFEGALSAALDLSAALGTDLQSASLQVGKALEDPLKGITALTRAGVSFSAAQKQQIRDFVEMGDKASAQKMILAELETQFGGQAEAAVTSSARMKVAFGNAAEAVGGVLTPALEAGARGAEFLASGLGALPGPLQTTAVLAAGGAIAWARWGEALSGWGSKVAAAGSKAVDLARTLSQGLDGVAATRGISKTQAGVEALKASLSTSVSDFGKFRSAAVAAAAGLAAFGATTAVLEDMASFHGDVSALAADLDQFGRGVADIDVIAGHFGGSIEGLAGSFKLAYDNSSLAERGVNAWKSAMTFDKDQFGEIRQAQSDIEALDQALAQAVGSGNVEAARTAYGELAAALIKQGVATEDIAGFLPTYWDAIDRADRETAEAAASSDGMTRAQVRLQDQLVRSAAGFESMGSRARNAFAGLTDGIDLAEQAAGAYMNRALDVFSAQQAYDSSTTALTAHQREAAEVQQQNADNTRKNAEALRQHAAAVEQAADQVQAATDRQADAQDALTQAYADALPTAEAMVDAEERVADAREGTIAAADRSRLAQEGLNAALVAGAQHLKDLAEANSDNERSVESAQLAYDKAIAAQQELASKGSDDPFAEREMILRVADALDALEGARQRAAESAQAQADADKAGVEGTPQVVAARREIAAAAEGEVTANERLDEALKQQAATQEEAAARIAAAQAGVAAATAALNDAQTNLATTQSAAVELSKNEAVAQTGLGGVILSNAQAKLDLAKAEAEANGKTLTAADSARILRAGLDEGRIATGFWSTDLEILGGKLDYAANSRTVELDTVGAMERARLLGQRVETLPNGNIRITADTSQADGALDALGMKIGALGSQLTGQLGAVLTIATGGARANGGDVLKGQTYLVGEKGPELWTATADGYITDAGRTRALLGASTSGSAGLAMAQAHGVAPAPIQIIVHGHVLTDRALVDIVADGMNRAASSSNRPLLDARVTR